MIERIPTHRLPPESTSISAMKIFRFKNSPPLETDNAAPLPITPLPTDAPHRHSYYEILFIEEGEGFHEIDFQTYPIQGAGMHFLMPGQVHLLNLTSTCAGYILAFSDSFFSFYNPDSRGLSHYSFYRPTQRHAVLSLSEGDRKYFRNLLENMVADHLTPKTGQLMTGKSLGLLLQKCESIAQRTTVEQAPSFPLTHLVARFQQLVDAQYREQHTVQYYADALDISPDYLSKSARKYLGLSAGDYILTKLMLEAKRLLVFTAMSSKEIAYALHLEDPSYFGRLFKRKTGLTPNAYRASVRKSTII